MKSSIGDAITSVLALSVLLATGTLTEVKAELRPGQLTEARKTSQTPEQCLKAYELLLHDEIRNPTQPRRGTGGGIIDHDYQMNQFITAFLRTINRFDQDAGRWQNDPDALAALKRLAGEQRLSSARQVLQIVLGLCGERSVVPGLLNTAGSSSGARVRTRAISTLAKLNAIETIPDIIELVDDTLSIEAGKSCAKLGDECEREFPIRRAARYAVLHLGVRTVDQRQYQRDIARWRDFNLDMGSAVRVLHDALGEADEDHVSHLLSAISRIGGPDAKQSLRWYIDAHAETAESVDLVAHARKALNNTLDTTIEERRDRTQLPDKILDPSR